MLSLLCACHHALKCKRGCCTLLTGPRHHSLNRHALNRHNRHGRQFWKGLGVSFWPDPGEQRRVERRRGRQGGQPCDEEDLCQSLERGRKDSGADAAGAASADTPHGVHGAAWELLGGCMRIHGAAWDCMGTLGNAWGCLRIGASHSSARE